MSSEVTALRRSPLDDRHREAGGRMVPFAGWEMPVQYDGIRAEHLAVRRDVGVFDVSHMGQIQISGPGAFDLLQRLLSGDIRRLTEGGAQYGVICNPQGGILDDLITYRLAERRYLTVTNAANHERDLEWFSRHAADFDADVTDCRDSFSMIAVQGPRARALLARLADGPLMPRMHCGQVVIAGVPLLACATGYTGEDGLELLIDPDAVGTVWDALVSAGATPAGLGARDTLRLEACFPLYGNDLSTERGPIEAGLAWCCQERTGFIGAEVIAAVRAAGPAERLVPFSLDGPGIPRQGNPVIEGGVVTSGTFSPCLERGIGMAYLPADRAKPGEQIRIDVRGTERLATVQTKPLYKES